MKEQTKVLIQDVRVSVFNVLKKTKRKSLDYHNLNLRQFLKPLDVSDKIDKMKLKVKYKTENIGSWDTSSVAPDGMIVMFYNNSAFNQDISGWYVSNISS